MNLRSGNSVWPLGPIALETNWTQTVVTDVAIVGMGVSGALVADAVTELGGSVALIDFRPAAAGSTKASTAIIQYELDNPLYKLEEQIGLSRAGLVYRESFRAVKKLEAIIHSLPEEAQRAIALKKTSAIQLAYTEDEAEEIGLEFKARISAGFEMSWLDAKELSECYSFLAEAALYNRDSFTLNPVALTEALLARAEEKGARLLGGARLESYRHSGSDILLELEDGRRVVCRKLIVAAGYESRELLGLECGKLTSSYAGATAPGASQTFREDLCVWEVKQPYHYLRTTPDKRVIFGGRDKPFRNETLRDMLLPLEQLRLRRAARDLLNQPNLKFDYFWTGTFAESDDGMPFIGPMPEDAEVFVVFGAGGNGITFATQARNLACDWLAGRSSLLQSCYRLDREEEPETLSSTSEHSYV